MRILYIAHLTEIGGASIALRNIIKELSSDNDIAVLLPQRKGWLVDELIILQCQLYFSNFENMVYPTSVFLKYGWYHPIGYAKFIKGLANKLFKKWHAQRDLKRIILDFNPDIVHSNSSVIGIAPEVCKKMCIPHVWHLREYLPMGSQMYIIPSLRKFKNKLYKSGNYNIAITKGVYKYYDISKSNSTVIYDGVFDEPTSSKMVEYEQENYILVVGRIEAAKGIKLILDAFVKISKNYPQLRILFAGGFANEQYFEECRDFITSKELKDKIVFLGERKDVYTLMRTAKFLVVASPREGFGFTTAEAMLNGCLVIGCDTTGTKEQFDNGIEITGQEIGLRFKTREELISQMEYALTHDTLEMRKRAYDVVVSKYTIQEHGKQLISFYNKILKNP